MELTKQTEDKSFLIDTLFGDLRDDSFSDDSSRAFLFTYPNFKRVLKRCSKLNIGIFGIETWSDKQSWISIKVCEEYKKKPMDETWYWQAFYELSELTNTMYFHASFTFPSDFRKVEPPSNNYLWIFVILGFCFV